MSGAQMRAVRVLHFVALSVAVLGFGVAASTWLQSHTLDVSSGRELMNFGGLVGGVILGGVLLCESLRSTTWDARVTIGLYLCWIGIFGWYWFNRFGGSEVHSFNPQQVEPERIRRLLTSGVFFLLWVILCSISPALSVARKLRH